MIVENRDPDKRYPRASLSVGIIAVHPEFRRKGLGVQLIEFAKKMAFKCRKRLYVESFFEYKKLHFYEKLGFTKDAPKRYGGKPYHVFFLDPSPVNLDGLVKSPKVRHSGESRSPEPI